jgi:hypothetical protein
MKPRLIHGHPSSRSWGIAEEEVSGKKVKDCFTWAKVKTQIKKDVITSESFVDYASDESAGGRGNRGNAVAEGYENPPRSDCEEDWDDGDEQGSGQDESSGEGYSQGRVGRYKDARQAVKPEGSGKAVGTKSESSERG